jgi:hypothetical protein
MQVAIPCEGDGNSGVSKSEYLFIVFSLIRLWSQLVRKLIHFHRLIYCHNLIPFTTRPFCLREVLPPSQVHPPLAMALPLHNLTKTKCLLKAISLREFCPLRVMRRVHIQDSEQIPALGRDKISYCGIKVSTTSYRITYQTNNTDVFTKF